jgi:hypothetical protein
MEIVFEPTFAILPPKIETQTGDRDVGPRVIHSERKDDEMHIWVEGLSGREYSLSVLNEEYSGAVSGARLEGQKLVFRIPQGDEGKFLKHEIIVKLKSGAL